MDMKTHLRRITRYAGAGVRYLGYRLDRQRRDETRCAFVASHGLKQICDYWHPDGRPPRSDALAKLDWDREFPPVIYVKTDHLAEFARSTSVGIDKSFVLVSGCSDFEVGPRYLQPDVQRALQDHPQLQAWYAQNCNTAHPKLHGLPIGLDYHTLTVRAYHKPWGYFSTPVAQEASLNRARQDAPQLAKKAVTGYCNWHHVLDRGDRLKCINGAAYEILHLERLRIDRTWSWHNNAQHLFTISPLGNGFDCHRTWEAILLGTVPIVPRSGIASLFTGLPVCVVDDWSEVTVEYLMRKREWVLETEFDFAPLYLGWWRKRFQGAEELPSRVQTFQAFVDTAHQPLAPTAGRMPQSA